MPLKMPRHGLRQAILRVGGQIRVVIGIDLRDQRLVARLVDQRIRARAVAAAMVMAMAMAVAVAVAVAISAMVPD